MSASAWKSGSVGYAAAPSAEVPTVLMVGQSHMGTILDAYRDGGAAASLGFNLIKMHLHHERYRPNWEGWIDLVYNAAIEEDLKSIVSEHQPLLVLTSLWSNEHYVLGSLWTTEAYDFVLPEQPELPLSIAAGVIPYDLVRSYAASRMRWQCGMLQLIKSVTCAPVYQIAAPPPVASRALLFNGAGKPNQAMMQKTGVPPAPFRYKCWRLCRNIVKEFAAEANCHCLDPPIQAEDNHGFLRPEFYKDGLHANAEYGKFTLDWIKQAIADLSRNEGALYAQPSIPNAT